MGLKVCRYGGVDVEDLVGLMAKNLYYANVWGNKIDQI